MGTTYDHRKYMESRGIINEESRDNATHYGEEWTEYDDEIILEFWVNLEPGSRDEIGVAEALGRTIEACRCRAHYVRHGSVNVKTTTTTRRVGNVTVTETVTVEKRRPVWMDEEGLPEWYQ